MTIMGETVQLPADKPVALVLLEHRLRDREQAGAVGYPELIAVLGLVVGDDVVQRWVQASIGKQKLASLVMILGPAWSLPPEAGDGEGEAPPRETGGSSASSLTTSTTDGGSSSPTSTGSTPAAET